MIQILGLRPYWNKKKQKELVKHAFFEKQWRADSVQELFMDLPKYLEKIPEEERWNIFFTVANTHGNRPRDFKFQDVIAIDIDGVEEKERCIEIVCANLGLKRELTGIVDSGNGVHFYIKLEKQIGSPKYFDEMRPFYKALCQKVNYYLQSKEVAGKCDPAVWDAARIMRLPGTENRKPEKDTKHCRILNSVIEAQGFNFVAASGLPQVPEEDQISNKVVKTFAAPDTDTILKECEFLKHCRDNAETLSEQNWYAMLSIVPHLDKGHALAHKFSEPHPGYTPEETDEKIEQAMAASGPRTCNNINALWGKCSSCKHFNKVKSPILVKGPDYISTEKTGFHTVTIGNNGGLKKIPNYDDLFKVLDRKTPVKTTDAGVTWRFTGTNWDEFSKAEIKAFAEKKFNPKPNKNMRAEFYDKVQSNNFVPTAWFDESIHKKLNFKNGVYDLETGKLEPHSKRFGFRSVLPYDFDPNAQCPRFDQFLHEITVGREDLIKIILEFMGYAISGDKVWLHKALVLHGDGANGKSTLMDVMKGLVGKGFYSSLTLSALNDPQKRYLLEGKLFNLGDETDIHALAKSEIFKTMTGDGEIDVKRLYSQPYQFLCRAKLIIACNELPYTNDQSHGLYRRLITVPFDAIFTEGGTADPKIKMKLAKEYPGILNKCIAAYQGVKERGRFSDSETVQEAIEEYRNTNDSVRDWFRESVRVTTDGNDKVTTDELYNDFRATCQKRGMYTLSYQKFAKDLSRILPKEQRTTARVNGRHVRAYGGVKLIGEMF